MRFRFIKENRASLPTERLCQIMNVSSRGYRAYRSRSVSPRQREDMVLLAHIRIQHSLKPEQLWSAGDDGRAVRDWSGSWSPPRRKIDAPERNICRQNP